MKICVDVFGEEVAIGRLDDSRTIIAINFKCYGCIKECIIGTNENIKCLGPIRKGILTIWT